MLGVGARSSTWGVNRSRLARLAHLVVSREDVVCKLHLCNGGGAVAGQANGKPDDALLGEGRVVHAVGTWGGAERVVS